jgi:hypothetical protein
VLRSRYEDDGDGEPLARSRRTGSINFPVVVAKLDRMHREELFAEKPELCNLIVIEFLEETP